MLPGSKWLNIIIIGVVIYLVVAANVDSVVDTVSSYSSSPEEAVAPTQETTPPLNNTQKKPAKKAVRTTKITPDDDSFIGKAVNKFVRPIVERKLEEQMNKHYDNQTAPGNTSSSMFPVRNIIKGVGAQAICGQQVKISYQLSDSKGVVIEHIADERPATFTLGKSQIIAGIEYMLTRSINDSAMRIGGRRKARIPAQYAYDASDFSHDDVKAGELITAEVTLHHVSPELHVPDNMKQFSKKSPGGKAALCGNTLRISTTISDISGKIIEEKKNVSVTLGETDLPVGMLYGMAHATKNEVRTLLIPPALQQNLEGKRSAFIPDNFPEGQIMMIDVSVQAIGS